MNKRILVVDDDRDVCQTVADMLSQAGAEVMTAFGGADALDVLQKHTLDLALVDLLLGGQVSSNAVVDLAKLKKCPVITMSGTLASDPRGRDLATPHLVKPFSSIQLVDLIETTLSGRGRFSVTL